MLKKLANSYKKKYNINSNSNNNNNNNRYNDYKVITRSLQSTELFNSFNNNNYNSDNNNGFDSKYIVPSFVAFWAIAYTSLSAIEVSGDGLGDMGGIVGVGLVIILFFGLFGVAAYESFKPNDQYNDDL